MCGCEVKELTAELTGDTPTNEQAFYEAEKIDIELLHVAYTETESSVYRQKLVDADSTLGSKGNVDFDAVTDRRLPI